MVASPEWAKLQCECGSIEFRPKMFLNFRPGGGTNESPAGFTCRQCDADVDVARLIQLGDLRRKKQELAALQQEVAAEVANREPAKAK